MQLEFTPLHPTFAAEVGPIDLRSVRDPETLEAIREGMDRFAVLVFRDQPFTDEEQIEFAQRLDGALHTKTGVRVLGKNRLGTDAFADISNVDARGEILPPDDRRRLFGLANRLWHTDASFESPAGRYSMLSARRLPAHPPDTEFADTRTAWDRLPASTRDLVEGLEVHHSIAYSRQTLGFEFSPDELETLKGAVHPLVRELPPTGRRALYLASHASRIVGWTLPEGRLLLRDLMEHATAPDLVYRHAWRERDFVIWDNRATMHRARPFADRHERRELRRVTTLDIGIRGQGARQEPSVQDGPAARAPA